MGGTDEQQRVLRARRLPLGPIGHHHRSPPPLRADRSPLGRHGEPSAAVADQAARFDPVDQITPDGSEIEWSPPCEMLAEVG